MITCYISTNVYKPAKLFDNVIDNLIASSLISGVTSTPLFCLDIITLIKLLAPAVGIASNRPLAYSNE